MGIKTILGAVMDMCVCGYLNTFDPCVIEDGYRIQTWGYGYCNTNPFNMDAAMNTATACGGGGDGKIHRRINSINKGTNKDEDDDGITVIMDGSDELHHRNTSEVGTMMRTLADYKAYYGFSMGMYLQEFSIDEAAARLLIELVNNNPSLYDLGLAWGGINGMTVHGIQPGRFTSTDGYWNQRRLGRLWKGI